MNATLGETRSPTDEARIDLVIERVLSGMPIRQAIVGAYGSVKSLYDDLSRLREPAHRFARAMEIRAEIWADEMIEIADTDQDASRARNRIQARQWNAAKANPKKFGERIDLNVQQTISINDARSAYLSRIRRPVSDQLDVSDAQLVESPSVQLIGPADIESVPVEKPGDVDPLEPDIFS